MKLNNKGFTLIELVVVLMIMSLIASIALPNIIKIQNKAKEEVDAANRHTLLNSAKIYYINENITDDQRWTKDNELWKDYLDKWPENPFDKSSNYFVDILKSGEIKVGVENKESKNE